jgi:hypothetical protein
MHLNLRGRGLYIIYKVTFPISIADKRITHSSTKAAAKGLNFKNLLSVNRVCSGERSNYKGYTFEYKGGYIA